MSAAVFRVKIKYEVVDTNDEWPRYLGRAIDEALPSTFWNNSKYVIGTIFSKGDAVQETVELVEGQHYIIVGTSADASLGYWHQIKISIIDPSSGALITSATSGKDVSRSKYYCFYFTLKPSGTGTASTSNPGATNVNPGEKPSGVNGAGANTGGELSTMMEQMRTTMGSMFNMMAQMMMYMAMMQMMVGMMSGLASAMGSAF